MKLFTEISGLEKCSLASNTYIFIFPIVFIRTIHALTGWFLNHKFEVYLNLAARMKLSGINQLWVADISYIRLKAEFVYLAVILDGFSRKVVGWALDRTLAVRLTLGALEQAIERRQPEPGLVHHSDRGFPYAHAEYVAILEKYHMVDNASCESFIKTLKREEIYTNKYEDLEHLRRNIEEFIEEYYNWQRLHSALGYRSPEEFNQTRPMSKFRPVPALALCHPLHCKFFAFPGAVQQIQNRSASG